VFLWSRGSVEKKIKTLKQWDDRLCVTVFQWHGKKIIDRTMIAASWFGHGFLYPVVVIGVALFNPTIRKPLISAGVVSFLVELCVYLLIKFIIRRPRPSYNILEIRHRMSLPDPYSFPSGHAAASFVMATLLSHFFPAIAVPLYAVAVLIGVSRIYNGLHYPSDVLAGWILGAASARIGLVLMT